MASLQLSCLARCRLLETGASQADAQNARAALNVLPPSLPHRMCGLPHSFAGLAVRPGHCACRGAHAHPHHTAGGRWCGWLCWYAGPYAFSPPSSLPAPTRAAHMPPLQSCPAALLPVCAACQHNLKCCPCTDQAPLALTLPSSQHRCTVHALPRHTPKRPAWPNPAF